MPHSPPSQHGYNVATVLVLVVARTRRGRAQQSTMTVRDRNRTLFDVAQPERHHKTRCRRP